MVKSYYFGLKEIVQLFSVRGSYFQNFDFCLASSLSRFYLDPCKRKTGSLFKHRHDPARVWSSSMNNYQVWWVVKDSLDLTMIENVYLTSSMSHVHLLAPSSFSSKFDPEHFPLIPLYNAARPLGPHPCQ